MEIYLFRHGIAEDARAGEPDSARKLTSQGRNKAAAVARMAHIAGVKPALIISSPYVRAVETARVAAHELGYSGEVLTAGELVPHGSPENVWRVIQEQRDESSVLLAGHEPLMSQIAAFLLSCPSLRIEMKKSALLRIDVDSFRAAPQGVLRWMLVPKFASD